MGEEEKKGGRAGGKKKGGEGAQKWRKRGVSWVGYGHRGLVEREIWSKGMGGFEKIIIIIIIIIITKKNQKVKFNNNKKNV